MKLLLHICCAPCALMPVEQLRGSDLEVLGYFYNPNIHPYQEHERRLAALRGWAEAACLPLLAENYDPVPWLRQTVFREKDRCFLCYAMRLRQSAACAKQLGAEAFSSTLLYSIYQNREQLIAAGRQAGQAWEVEFMEYDFRPLWALGQAKAGELQLYRQPYCGCIFSEAERYMKKKLPPSMARGEFDAVQPS
jgi:predicted adenine nucleotide alpha hydrolase (AANH) superfamily ATPase